VSEETQAVDIGSGLGALTFALSEVAGHVVSVEPVWERLEFQRIRASQEGPRNIEFVLADALTLPFPSRTFDLAILNGVLEWIGTTRVSGNPYELQLAVLRQVHRILKTGGYLCLGIDNRLGIDQLLGSPDPHTKLRYTGFMPRWLADRYLAFRHGFSYKAYAYRTYTYSLRGYRQLLARAGFADVQAFGAFPSYSIPTYMVCLEREAPLRYFLKNVYLPGRRKNAMLRSCLIWLSRVGIARYFVPHNFFIARSFDAASHQ
jgi:ubiquinone/menaquinone biosynthesis C-methylase UbiE